MLALSMARFKEAPRHSNSSNTVVSGHPIKASGGFKLPYNITVKEIKILEIFKYSKTY
jgi:hypothetical protein